MASKSEILFTLAIAPAPTCWRLPSPMRAESYNLGSGKGTNINQIYSTLKEITGYPGQVLHGPAKLGETRQIYLDAHKAGQELGWEPTVGLSAGLKLTVEVFSDGGAVRLIIVQTPLRISLFGGGTDFASYYRLDGGAVLTSAIDKYIFITVKPRFDQKLPRRLHPCRDG